MPQGGFAAKALIPCIILIVDLQLAIPHVLCTDSVLLRSWGCTVLQPPDVNALFCLSFASMVRTVPFCLLFGTMWSRSA